MDIKLKNATIYTGEKVLHNAAIGIRNGQFTSATDGVFDTITDLQNDILVPGFIDLQLYGGNGMLFSDAPSDAALTAMYHYSLAGGATRILPTVATSSRAIIFKAIAIVKKYMVGNTGILGLHLEGPFINAAKKGAHIEEYITPLTMAYAKELVAAAEGCIKIITLAAECCDAGAIAYLIDNGITISVGHSAASFEQARETFDKGAAMATHLFNAMPPLHHREPGLPGAVMQHSTAMASIVADGIHVDYNMVAIAKKVMQERLFLITDAVTASNGVYPHKLHGDRYLLPDGTLSGSALTMIKAVRNCIEKAGIEKEEAFRMATLYPAKAIGIAHQYGKIKPGYTADYVHLDSNLQIKAVAKDGIETLP